MENYINPILTLILIGIYWFNTKAQNSKISAQSDIINELKEHVKFFDVKKIKEYVELRESEKDKLMDIAKQAIEKEYELKSQLFEGETNSKENNSKDFHLLKESLKYIASELIWLKESELETLLEEKFPNSKDLILDLVLTVQKDLKKHTGLSTMAELKEVITKR